ncbi:MAG: type III pantothenate kinase [Candidatus Eremiobacteraeota bacterium]|nr:type III pantothenate kinase [Candidatus Eremiobacteraeota bacterium]
MLAIDAGNTNIVLGLFREGELVHHWRIHTDRQKLVDEYADLIASLLNKVDIKPIDIKKVAISNVVPSFQNKLTVLSRRSFGVEPFFVSYKNKLNFNIKIDNPKELGADIIAAAVAGVEKYGIPSIIIDFGTATTITAIDRDGDFLGGSIAPGLAISCEALYDNAPHLPRINLVNPPSMIGKNTVTAMQSGIYLGYGHLVRGIVGEMKQIIGDDAKVIAAGGLAGVFDKGHKIVDVVDQDIVLEGIYILYKMNRD